jgi:hypothetical protein
MQFSQFEGVGVFVHLMEFQRRQMESEEKFVVILYFYSFTFFLKSEKNELSISHKLYIRFPRNLEERSTLMREKNYQKN